MSQWFAPDRITLALVALTMLAAMLLALRHARRQRWLLAMLQVPCAVLLLAALLLRDDAESPGLVVLTADADPQAASQMGASWPVVALPGAPAMDGADQVPDLATALRRFPAATRLHVIGAGLDARDREALGTRDLSFAPSSSETEATVIVELDGPAIVRAGAWWTVRGRVANPSTQTVELRDPADRAVATTTPDERGEFVLRAVSRADGPALFSLRLLDGEHVLQTIPLPIDARSAPTVRALLLAAAPSPELKFLRRWALDAGVDLASRVALSPGIAQRRGTPAIDAAALAQLDLLIVDERSWSQLASQQEALREAIDRGLGLLIRITGPVPERVLRDWKQLGFEPVFAASKPSIVHLAGAETSGQDDELHAWPVTLHGDGNIALLRDNAGAPLAMRRLFGRGRIGISWLSDSHRLATRGARETHATLWSEVVSVLARARGEAPPGLPPRAVVGQRASVCAAAQSMQIIAPDGTRTALLREPSGGGCAAFWPTQPGWHRLERNAGGAAGTEESEPAAPQAFYVFAPRDIGSLVEHETRQATTALVNRSGIPTERRFDRDMLRALLLLAWLSLSALLWHLERRVRRRS